MSELLMLSAFQTENTTVSVNGLNLYKKGVYLYKQPPNNTNKFVTKSRNLFLEYTYYLSYFRN